MSHLESTSPLPSRDHSTATRALPRRCGILLSILVCAQLFSFNNISLDIFPRQLSPIYITVSVAGEYSIIQRSSKLIKSPSMNIYRCGQGHGLEPHRPSVNPGSAAHRLDNPEWKPNL